VSNQTTLKRAILFTLILLVIVAQPRRSPQLSIQKSFDDPGQTKQLPDYALLSAAFMRYKTGTYERFWEVGNGAQQGAVSEGP
jgi:hypothetical protein